MFSFSRLFGVRRTLQRFWADTEIAPPDTVILAESDRLELAESEWFSEGLFGPHPVADRAN